MHPPSTSEAGGNHQNVHDLSENGHAQNYDSTFHGSSNGMHSSSTDTLELRARKTHEETSHSHRLASPMQSHVDAPQSAIREVAFVATLCMAQLFTQAGLAMALQPLHIIGASFKITDPGQLSWFLAAYSLTVGTFILPAGRLGDLFGHKKFFILGSLWYGIWSILGGLSVYSSSRIFFDICRAMQGIGPAFMLPNAVAIIGRTYKASRKQEMIFSAFGATAPNGYVIGALFSSLFAQLAWWPWAYWAMGIACFLLAVAGLLIIPNTPRPVFEDNSISMVSRIDAAGSATGVIGLVLINFAWNQAPTVGWQTPYIYVILVIGFMFIGAFAVIESKAQFPLVPFEYMNADVGFVLGCMALGWSSFGIWVFYTLQILEILRGATPLYATALMSPVTISGICAAFTAGYVFRHVPASFVITISMMAFTIGISLIGTMPVEQSYWIQTFISFIVMPWGMDFSWPAATIVLSNTLPHEHQGLAASLVNTVVNYSISLGLGFAGTIEVHVNDGGLNVLKGYRGAMYMGIGLASLSVFTSVMFMFSTGRKRTKQRKVEQDVTLE